RFPLFLFDPGGLAHGGKITQANRCHCNSSSRHLKPCRAVYRSALKYRPVLVNFHASTNKPPRWELPPAPIPARPRSIRRRFRTRSSATAPRPVPSARPTGTSAPGGGLSAPHPDRSECERAQYFLRPEWTRYLFLPACERQSTAPNE